MASIFHSLKHAWNVFRNRDPTDDYVDIGPGYYYRPDKVSYSIGNDRSIVTAVFNRIAMDAASIDMHHVRLDDKGNFFEIIDSNLERCFTTEANIDQTGRALMQDIVMSMLDEGCVALVPTETSVNPKLGSFDVLSLRVGKVIEWYPERVKVNLYNEATGLREDIILPKKAVALIENPLYSIINEKNSTMQRLIRKLNILDVVDEQSGAGKLDLIIQLPYVVKTPDRRRQAESRRKEIERQLTGSKYGIAYTDGTEKITQLNRPVSNNLMTQIEYLTSMLYSQLGITQSVMDGTAEEKVMVNYYNRTIEPILASIRDESKRKFLTKTAITQKQSIFFYRDPFKLMPVDKIAETADKLTRNEIMSPNELRSKLGLTPSDDPHADELRNRNINAPSEKVNDVNNYYTEEEFQNGTV